jgi:hypothetical protein
VCNGRTTTSAAGDRASDPCKISSNLEKHTVAVQPRRMPLYARPALSATRGQAFLARFSLLLLLSSCGEAEQEAEQCRSLDARSSVVKIFSDDENNALVTFALKNSSKLDAMMGATKSEIEKLAILDNAKRGAVYSLGGTILMKSKDRATREITCNGILSVTVLETSAEKEIEFKVKQTTSADRTPLVSVSPFLFK